MFPKQNIDTIWYDFEMPTKNTGALEIYIQYKNFPMIENYSLSFTLFEITFDCIVSIACCIYNNNQY